jgi:hypothetical protein
VPLSNRAIALYAVVVLGIGAVAFIVLLWLYDGLDAIRTATAITVAAGGGVTLLLAARRQRSTEETLEYQRQTLEHQREDAAEQRITALYTHAVDQLGAEKAPVRLGGLHALERLAQNNPDQRQTIVDVICAYLRMPYTPPEEQAPGEDAPEDAHRRYEQRRQELQVRLTAQRILTAHLRRPKAAEVFWADIRLDLTEAHLHQFNLTGCHIWDARFDRAKLTGNADFRFTEFAGHVMFHGATFTGDAVFDGATFAGHAMFHGATFTGDAEFRVARFAGTAEFTGATFTGDAVFSGAAFAGSTEFDGARVAPGPFVILPKGWTTLPAAEGEEEGWLYVVHDEDSSEQSAESARVIRRAAQSR